MPDAPQVEVNAVEADSGDVLAEAAVASAALSGAATVAAGDAKAAAEQADAKAQAAGEAATAATAIAADKVDAATVDSLVDAKIDAFLERLTARATPEQPVVAETQVEVAIEPDTPPADFKKPGKAKRQTFAQRYMGIEPKDDE